MQFCMVFVGLLYSSIRRKSKVPGRFRFHILSVGNTDNLISYLKCCGLDAASPKDNTLDTARVIRIHHFSKDGVSTHFSGNPEMDALWKKIQKHIIVQTSTTITGNLASRANFARFMIPLLFRTIDCVIYLDADVIVQRDLFDLWKLSCTRHTTGNSDEKAAVAAVARSFPTYGVFFSDIVQNIFKTLNTSNTFSADEKTFNAGVMIFYPSTWLAYDLNKLLVWWMTQHHERYTVDKGKGLWEFGTQPLLLLTVHGVWHSLPSEWNVNGLGYKKGIDDQSLNRAFILHWSGRYKPWLPSTGLYRNYWLPFSRAECSGHGTCRGEGKGCECQNGWSGLLCHSISKNPNEP